MFAPNLPRWISGPMVRANDVLERDHSHLPPPWPGIRNMVDQIILFPLMMVAMGLWIICFSFYAIPKKLFTGRWPLEGMDPTDPSGPGA
jgi:hypothetical protein